MISSLSQLSASQKQALKKGGLTTVSDVILISPSEIAKKCRIPPSEAQAIVDCISREKSQPCPLLEDVCQQGSEVITTGDTRLDNILCGGLRTGMIWEVVGESSAGKTQFALQLSLLVQLPPSLGGLSSTACYITTSSKLPTSRLLSLSESHPSLGQSPHLCGLQGIHTLTTDTPLKLIKVLSETLSSFLETNSRTPDSRPVKLVVIDALAELFHSATKTTTNSLVDRSKNISEISSLLHSLATKWQLAILVLNEVTDVFNREPTNSPSISGSADLVYYDQARWFNRADSVPGEDRKEANLGLVWANQVNARIMFSKTGRRRHLEEHEYPPKRQRTDDTALQDSSRVPSSRVGEDTSALIRRLSLLFSSISAPASLDYIITTAGLSTLPGDENIAPTSCLQRAPQAPISHRQSSQPTNPFPQPLDIDSTIEDTQGTPEDVTAAVAENGPDVDEEELYWSQMDPPEVLYGDVDLTQFETNQPVPIP
ncbi:hypothetical protein JAAARDRAFT_623123 [Jaapia argillacea MUCL 33604]|uniref:RecA family profile 1 domain-containing protein n=1 Tax=Jaapia argillacea MUCL 33604 TaxID=933084 RepID=A0A067Q7M8_9AGAM|nr:hypothetical protein JAAARDRAFT_623123 [Jaapia argillacea MUCL 33604]